MSKKVSDEFVDYIANSGKTKLTSEQLFEEFVSGGFYERCKASIPAHVMAAIEHWDDNAWKMYIHNYCKMHFNVRAMCGKPEYKNILA